MSEIRVHKAVSGVIVLVSIRHEEVRWREVSAVTSIRVDPRVQEVTWARKQELNSS